MTPGIKWKSILVAFAIVAVLYFGAFYGMEYWKQRKGPWEVSFNVDGEGNPALVIYQPKLNISSVEVLFPGEKVGATNLNERIAFDALDKKLPFGKLIYQDLTALPGVVTLEIFGHVVELFPRALLADKKEYPWKSEATIELSITNKPGPIKPSPQKRI
jgi:hypothetical protein